MSITKTTIIVLLIVATYIYSCGGSSFKKLPEPDETQDSVPYSHLIDFEQRVSNLEVAVEKMAAEVNNLKPLDNNLEQRVGDLEVATNGLIVRTNDLEKCVAALEKKVPKQEIPLHKILYNKLEKRLGDL